MRVLVVEDIDDEAQSLIDAVGTARGIVFERARSRSGAEDLIGSDRVFDLLVCDLRIPHHDGGIDRIPQHGMAVHAAMARLSRGTPTIFLTGVAEQNIDDLSAATSGGSVTDDLGDGEPLQMVRLFRKDRLLACAQAIVDLSERLAALDSIELEDPHELVESLAPMERRSIALAARQWQGVRATLRPLGGGLSGGRTIHALIHDDEHERASVFLKIDEHDRCIEESDRYHDFVVGTLLPGAFPQLVKRLVHCLGRSSCLVYKFADGWDGSLFDFIRDGGDQIDAVRRVRELMTRWETMRESRRATYGQLREPLISLDQMCAAMAADYDDGLDDLMALVDACEQEAVELVVFPQHGDLHGANVLYSPTAGATLIDCGDTGLHTAGWDPVTLELSLICHPSSPAAGTGWPDDDAAFAWKDLERFVAECPYPEYVRACRQWSGEVASDVEATAAAYEYLVRQLKYPDTPKRTIAAMLRGLVTA